MSKKRPPYSNQTYPLYFFTDINTDISNYCLLNIKRYYSKKKNDKRICFIDPSVYELKQSAEYSRINMMFDLLDNNKLLDNEYISVDYPCDMNEKYTDLFIEKSYQNNVKYKNNLNYICTIQSKFRDLSDFVYQTEKLKNVWDISGKIIGIGNTCRILYVDTFLKDVLNYIKDTMQGKHIHFYGTGMRIIKSKIFNEILCSNIKVSVDSTKWTRAITQELKDRVGSYNCNKNTRDLFFTEYMKSIEKYGIKVVY